MEYTYKTKGTCSWAIHVTLEGNVVTAVRFDGGCNGNTSGIATLVTGMTVEEIESKLAGIPCGKSTSSCPAQLAVAVREAYQARLQNSHFRPIE